MTTDEDEAPGWDAIDAALRPLVSDTAPLHWGGTNLPDQGGLWGVSAYPRPEHWFFVTYGLSELFLKVGDDPEISGWGEELTMRLHRGESPDPPAWAAPFLGRLGELVFQRSTAYAIGTRLQFNDGGSDIPPAVAFAADPELSSELRTPNGRLQFVAVVPINLATLDQMRASSTVEVVEKLRVDNPLLIGGAAGTT